MYVVMGGLPISRPRYGTAGPEQVVGKPII